MSWQLDAGESYYMHVDGCAGSAVMDFKLNLQAVSTVLVCSNTGVTVLAPMLQSGLI